MPITLLSASLNFLNALVISVEIDSGGGDFGRISIVGLPDTAAGEAKERVKSAIRNCGFDYPRRGITVNLAPADLKKKGTAFDLPIAIGILALKNKLNFDKEKDLFIGELSLSGELRGVKGVLPIALKAAEEKMERIFLADENAHEASLVKNLKIIPLKNLREAIGILSKKIQPRKIDSPKSFKLIERTSDNLPNPDNIIGQQKAKRALQIMAAGRHNLIFCGPPGSGKSALAKMSKSLLPPLDDEEKLEVMKIYSTLGIINTISKSNIRPFRCPHHSSSAKAIIGGNNLQPGEMSLAHRGLLFLDELPEFSRDVLEALREPLEEGVINISRVIGSESFPARFVLIGAMNPCPCGFYGDHEKNCSCNKRSIEVYRKKISGPILDRIDLFVDIKRFSWLKNTDKPTKNTANNAKIIREQISLAAEKQKRRLMGTPWKSNAEIPSTAIEQIGYFQEDSLRLAKEATEKLKLSIRSYFKILKVARTIADLEGQEKVTKDHIAEALQYRDNH